MMVVIPQGKKETAKNFQLRLVKDPTSFTGANKNFRPEYIMKWLNRNRSAWTEMKYIWEYIPLTA